MEERVNQEVKRNTWPIGTWKGLFFFISTSSDKFTVKLAREIGLEILQAGLSHKNSWLLFNILYSFNLSF